MLNKICNIRIEGGEEQISETCRRLALVMLICDNSRNYPNKEDAKYWCYLKVNIGNPEHFQ